MKQILMTVALLLTTALTACGGSADSDGPPTIRYGRDVCTQCGMIISEERFAAAYTLEDGTEKSFDDLGGLLLTQRETGDTIEADRTWVHDYETAHWIVASDAWFVATLSATSPMGHSILAFSDEKTATRFAYDVDGEVVRWETVFAMPEQGGLIGHHHAGMEVDTGTGKNDQSEDSGQEE